MLAKMHIVLPKRGVFISGASGANGCYGPLGGWWGLCAAIL